MEMTKEVYDTIIRVVKAQVIAEFEHRCTIWIDIEDGCKLPPPFERVCNQDGEPVFRNTEGTWKSAVTGKVVEVTSWCELPKRERC